MAGGAPFCAQCAVPTAEQMPTEQMEQVAVPASVWCSGKSASLPEHLAAHRVYLLYCALMTHITSDEHKVEAGESVGLHQMQQVCESGGKADSQSHRMGKPHVQAATWQLWKPQSLNAGF